ncbi:hypothetical protein AAES_140639 [Amazona aestiva]|uniref:Uncharacterized protein n=1 Tax=Amazona aestiva TaxID=12930 RepID=A0A0Q3T5E5_AMAAE|nr:hypothetical protein AAES_140639 [Amazona aestiva]
MLSEQQLLPWYGKHFSQGESHTNFKSSQKALRLGQRTQINTEKKGHPVQILVSPAPGNTQQCGPAVCGPLSVVPASGESIDILKEMDEEEKTNSPASNVNAVEESVNYLKIYSI